MTTRKPVPNNLVPQPLSHGLNNPPYPTSPIMPSEPSETHPGFEHIDSSVPSAPNGADSRSRASSVSSHDTWNSGGTADEDEVENELDNVDQRRHDDLPAPLRISHAGLTHNDHDRIHSQDHSSSQNQKGPVQSLSMPPIDATRFGHPSSGGPATSKLLGDQNPYFKMQSSKQPSYGAGDVSQPGTFAPQQPGRMPPQPPRSAPVPPGITSDVEPPSKIFSGMSLHNGQSSDHQKSSEGGDLLSHDEAGFAPVPSNATGKSASSQYSISSNPWQEDLDREKTRVQSGNASQPLKSSILDDSPTEPTQNGGFDSAPPPEKSVKQPILQVPDGAGSSSKDPEPETPGARAKRQRNEFYHIKHVNWYDVSSAQGRIRKSPILTQNANGPCPLLALVNALSLSTPAGLETALTQVLHSREQITIGLLLDAVFEELVRRSETSGKDLPDISDLYSFLITLHTGMNVNPRFVPERATSVSNDGTTSPGDFEATKEMELYGAFDIPLFHGWIAPRESPVYAAMDRSAATFDEALNMQFHEEELERKLHAQGLSLEEQAVFEDLSTVKEFLMTFPTQLSEYGLKTISNSMSPGQIAILFRNDHFSTLYKEPRRGVLMTLVTDAGYSSHNEIVWESLVDVSGAGSEFFSGDFRPVGTSGTAGPSQGDDYTGPSTNGWQTVQSRKSQQSAKTPSAPVATPESSTNLEPPGSEIQRTASEQEDHDLALALQLQEEEEDRNRRETAARRQEEESLSQQFLESEQSQPNQNQQRQRPQQQPPLPPRRNGRNPSGAAVTQQPQALNSSSRTDDSQAPPPTYEQAASDLPYREAGSTPSRPAQGNALGALSALDAQRHQSAFAAQSAQYHPGPSPSPVYESHRRRTSGYGAGRRTNSQAYQAAVPGRVAGTFADHRDERCIMM